MIVEEMIFGLEDDDVLSLEIGLFLLPFSSGLQGVEVLPAPSSPEVMDHGLTLVPASEEMRLVWKPGVFWVGCW